MGKTSFDSAAAPSGTPYTPVAVCARHDGWSAERQRAFIAALAEGGCVAEACAAVGIAPRRADRLRVAAHRHDRELV